MSIEVKALLRFDGLKDTFAKSDVGQEPRNDSGDSDAGMNGHCGACIEDKLRRTNWQRDARSAHFKEVLSKGGDT